MNMKSPRLDDKFNVVALATIVAMVLSIGSALVSVEMDTGNSATAQATPTQTQTQTTAPAQTVASITVVAAH